MWTWILIWILVSCIVGPLIGMFVHAGLGDDSVPSNPPRPPKDDFEISRNERRLLALEKARMAGLTEEDLLAIGLRVRNSQ